MRAAPPPLLPPALVVDSVHLFTPAEAQGLRTAGVKGVAQYLGSLTRAGAQGIVDAGLGLFPVTYADHWDGPRAVAELQALAFPQGLTAFLDVEGVVSSSAALIASINQWATAILAAGYVPGLYVGAGALLTSAELYALKVERYWKGISRVEDRNGALAEPLCGWAMIQRFPGDQVFKSSDDVPPVLYGLEVDVSVVGTDYRGRELAWAVAP